MEVVVGFGGNVGDVEVAFRAARAGLSGAMRLLGVSGLYRTRAVGPSGQPDYLNAAVRVDWPGRPSVLLDLCGELELAAGRDRTTEVRWGPRALDLDLLAADRVVCRGPRLELPHPRLRERGFALVPAAEVAPAWVHPLDGRRLAELARCLSEDDRAAVTRTSSRW